MSEHVTSAGMISHTKQAYCLHCAVLRAGDKEPPSLLFRLAASLLIRPMDDSDLPSIVAAVFEAVSKPGALQWDLHKLAASIQAALDRVMRVLEARWRQQHGRCRSSSELQNNASSGAGVPAACRSQAAAAGRQQQQRSARSGPCESRQTDNDRPVGASLAADSGLVRMGSPVNGDHSQQQQQPSARSGLCESHQTDNDRPVGASLAADSGLVRMGSPVNGDHDQQQGSSTTSGSGSRVTDRHNGSQQDSTNSKGCSSEGGGSSGPSAGPVEDTVARPCRQFVLR
jgi:hypothetical protein